MLVKELTKELPELDSSYRKIAAALLQSVMTQFLADSSTPIKKQLALDVITAFRNLLKSMGDELEAKIEAITPVQPNVTRVQYGAVRCGTCLLVCFRFA